MKLRYPAEAFALGIILFSAGMKEAFAAGILVIFTSVFAELLKISWKSCSCMEPSALCIYCLRLCLRLSLSGGLCGSGNCTYNRALDHGISCRPSVRQTRSLRKYRG